VPDPARRRRGSRPAAAGPARGAVLPDAGPAAAQDLRPGVPQNLRPDVPQKGATPLTLTGNARHRHRRAVGADGVAGNERLTAMTGTVLLALFAAEGVTILRLHELLTV